MKTQSFVPVVAASSVLGLFLSGCAIGGSPDDSPQGCEAGLGKKVEVLHAMQQGWRVDPKAGIMLDTTKTLFNLCKEHVSITSNSKTDITIKTSETASEASDALEVSVGVEGSYGAFSAAVSASSASATSSKYKTSRVDKSIISQIYKVSVNTQNMFDLMSKENSDFLTTGKPADIVDRFGEFYATEGGFGGIFRSVAIIEMQEHQESSDIQAEAEASFVGNGIKMGTSVKSASEHSDAKAYWEMNIFGGDQKPWLSVADESGLEEAQKAWAGSFKDDNLYAMSLKLKPIWEVLEGHEDAQAKKIKDYLTAKWKSDKDNIVDFGADKGYVPQKGPKIEKKDYTATVDGCVAHEAYDDYSLNAEKEIGDGGMENADCFCKKKHGNKASVVKGSFNFATEKDHTINCGETSSQGCFWKCNCYTMLTCEWPANDPENMMDSESMVTV